MSAAAEQPEQPVPRRAAGTVSWLAGEVFDMPASVAVTVTE